MRNITNCWERFGVKRNTQACVFQTVEIVIFRKTKVGLKLCSFTHSPTVEYNKLIFVQYKCCGIYNYTDWRDNAYYNETNSVPDSCCKNETVKCGRDGLQNPDKINKKVSHGCGYKSACLSNEYRIGYVIILIITCRECGVLMSLVASVCVCVSACQRVKALNRHFI